MFVTIIRSDIPSILMKYQHRLLREKAFEIVLKIGACLITLDELIMQNELFTVSLLRYVQVY